MNAIGDVSGAKASATQFALSEMEVAIESRRKELVPITTDELLAMEIPAIQWVIPNTIPIPGLVALSSKPGVGKTNLVTWICWQASQGLPAFRALDGDDLGFLKQENHEPIKTLIIQEETSELIMQNRIKGFKGKSPGNMLQHMFFKNFKLSSQTDVALLKDYLKTNEIKLLVLDPFSSVLGASNENDNAEVSKIMDVMRELINELNIGIIFLHHPAKGEEDGEINLRGAGDILGKVDVHITLEVVNPEQRDVLKLSYEKLRIADSRFVSNFKVQMVGNTDMGDFEFIYAGKSNPEKKKDVKIDGWKRRIIEHFMEIKPENPSRSTVAKALNARSTTPGFDKAFDELLDEELIKKTPLDLTKHSLTSKGEASFK
jgi:hypothetical protein